MTGVLVTRPCENSQSQSKEHCVKMTMKIKVMGLQPSNVRNCQQPSEGRREAWDGFPQTLQKERSLLASGFQTLSIQNYERINSYGFTPPTYNVCVYVYGSPRKLIYIPIYMSRSKSPSSHSMQGRWLLHIFLKKVTELGSHLCHSGCCVTWANLSYFQLSNL